MRQCKPKPCKVCKNTFQPRNSLQRSCDYKCAQITVQKANDKKAARVSKEAERAGKRDRAARKVAIRPKIWYVRQAQQQINKYVRLRDSGKPCCSCDKPDDGSHQRHASHYRSTKACSALRFNLKNIFASCQQCNTSLSGNILEYRIRLVNRYGGDFVNWLESQNQIVRYDIDYLKRLKKVFAKRCRMIENRV